MQVLADLLRRFRVALVIQNGQLTGVLSRIDIIDHIAKKSDNGGNHERIEESETQVIHAGQTPEPITGAVMPPVFQTSTYAQPWPAKHTGYEYARTQNPTREALERSVCALEGGADAIAFASGLAATATIIQTLNAGDLVICGDDVYGGTYRQFTQLFQRHGLRFQFVDLSTLDPNDAIPADAKMVWMESPTNPLLKITDIEAVARRAHEVGAELVVDNTFATPIFQRPLSLGADYVVHSTTKYINGHSDVVGGIVIAKNDALAQKIRFYKMPLVLYQTLGSWLTLRGIKTLALRMERHQSNAKAIVAWLNTHPEVRRVHYPMLETDPGYAVAKKQMMAEWSLCLDASRARGKVLRKYPILYPAESLGGVESC